MTLVRTEPVNPQPSDEASDLISRVVFGVLHQDKYGEDQARERVAALRDYIAGLEAQHARFRRVALDHYHPYGEGHPNIRFFRNSVTNGILLAGDLPEIEEAIKDWPTPYPY